ncbi:hypothetical protein [Acinetobacter sp. 226]|uniref:hypothetical protein n=1 Tax=Acinetobacter sp. 226 TaxID=3114699 RepID=UPI003A8B7031
MQKFFIPIIGIAGILLAILGLALSAGGVYLITLGGSWFYLIAGIMMILIGIGFFKRRSYALWIALILLALSSLWAIYEVGADFWQLVPRIVTFLVIAIVASLFAPLLLNKDGKQSLTTAPAMGISIVLLIGFFSFIGGMFKIHPLVTASGEKSKVIQEHAGQDQGNDWSA